MKRIGRTDIWDREREEREWFAWNPAERFRARGGFYSHFHRCQECDTLFRSGMEPVPEHWYLAHGLERILLREGVFTAPCPQCGEWHWLARAEPQLHHVLALALIGRPGSLVGPEIRFIRLQSHIPQRVLACALRVRRSTVADWERLATRGTTPGMELLLRAVLLRHFRAALERFGLHRLNMEHLDSLRDVERRLVREYDRIVDPDATGPVTLRWTRANYWTIE